MQGQEIVDFIAAHTDMTARELATATGVSKSTIYGICYRNNIKIKTALYIPKSTKQKTVYSRAQCRNRPQSCFSCTNPDCICADKCTPLETAYGFIGTGEGFEGMKMKVIKGGK